jgi:hypothetical protein
MFVQNQQYVSRRWVKVYKTSEMQMEKKRFLKKTENAVFAPNCFLIVLSVAAQGVYSIEKIQNESAPAGESSSEMPS